jgi:hypothetical protein
LQSLAQKKISYQSALQRHPEFLWEDEDPGETVMTSRIIFADTLLLRKFNSLHGISRLPVHLQLDALRHMTPLPDDRDHQLPRFFLGKVNQRYSSAIRDRALMRTLITALAVEEYRSENRRWPDSLEQIPARLLKEIPIDPYDGASLRYRVTPEGVVIYSVGLNRLDDLGTVSEEAQSQPKSDIGIRLWNPVLRRLTPAAD